MHRTVATSAILFCVELALIGCQLSAQRDTLRAVVQTAATLPSSTQPNAIVDIWDDSFTSEEAVEWSLDVAPRLHRPFVLVMCHGGYSVDHRIWLVYPETLNPPTEFDRPWNMETLIAIEQKMHPGLPIVFLACNVDGVVIHNHPNIFYSPSDTFVDPDSAESPLVNIIRHLRHPNTVGAAAEFVEAK